MNILYITQFFSGTRGGGEVISYEFARGMARRGHHVDVVSHKITNFKEEDNFDDVTVHRIRPAIEHPPSIRQNMIYN
jgi:hypothetical protein